MLPLFAPRSIVWQALPGRRQLAGRNEAIASKTWRSGSGTVDADRAQQKYFAALEYRSHEPGICSSITSCHDGAGHRRGTLYERDQSDGAPHVCVCGGGTGGWQSKDRNVLLRATLNGARSATTSSVIRLISD